MRPSFTRVAIAVAKKELTTEWRSGDAVPALAQFVVLALVVANFSFDLVPSQIPHTAPGILWLALVFVLLLVTGRAFGREKDEGTLDALLLTPASPSSLLAGKALASGAVLLVCEAVLVFGLGLFLGAPVLAPGLWLALLAATAGLAVIGCFFAALAVHLRGRDVVLPVLLLPVVVPFVVAGGRAIQLALTGATFDWPAFGLVLDFDILFVVAAALAARYVLDD